MGRDRPTLEKQAGSSRCQRRRATPRSTHRASPPLASLTGVPLSSQETAASRAALNDHADEPRVAIVTGGSRGIGRETVSRLAADGYAVVVGYAGNRDLAEAAVEEVTGAGGRAVAVRADVADEDEVAALFGTAESEFGGVDVVVHAAGRMYLAPVAELDLAELDAMNRTNIRGSFVIARQAARTLRAGGALIMFSTSVVGLAFPGYGGYSAGKGAVEALTMVLARELRGRDVTVNTVAPGPTATDLFL